ncbi:unnamed protein product [Medioppia subpectinata]|uniref:Uncharacterized protein n=1 Tax=Medioppia subpectinata TaxID=1979941 RepID=A0A7R9KRP3_9ACAR|nr:unnamed protein product [Medioppia subpectinata]CAG2107366.1 unnamed protein product [Medioppia subpectinata]
MSSWYSTSVFIITQNMLELIPTTIGANQYNEGNRIYMFFYAMQLCLHSTQGVAYMTVALFYRHRQVAFMVATNIALIHALLCGYFVILDDMGDIFQFLSNISQLGFSANAIFVATYGFGRCPDHQFSKLLHERHINDDNIYWKYTNYLWTQLLFLWPLMASAAVLTISSQNYYTKGISMMTISIGNIPTIYGLIPEAGCDLNITDTNDNMSDVSIDSQYHSLSGNEYNGYLSIAWIDLTLKVDKTLYSSEKLILRGVNGLFEFNSMNALMGPSGAGKTSLLRSLNGMYRHLMTEESKIYLSAFHTIRTCFIAQDQREHLITGLTLTPDIKPNLICVDEPTSGVDSYSALLMIKCFKKLSQKHSLTIITSIHQPNLEILMLFDSLYVLAKGGLTVYSGPPKHLSLHLQQCNIAYNREQIPIEVLMKIAAKGFTDQKVIELSDKTNENLGNNCRRLESQLKLHSNGISIKNKPFSIVNTYHLFNRSIANIFTYLWKQLVAEIIVMLILTYIVTLIFDFDFNHLSGCVPIAVNGSNGCRQTAQDMEDLKLSNYNVAFTESFFVVKSVMDLIPLVIIVVSVVAVVDNYDKEHTYWSLLLAIGLSSMSFQSLGQMCGICFEDNGVLVSILLIPLVMAFSNTVIMVNDLNAFLLHISQLDMFAAAMGYIRIWFNGSDRCPEGHISYILYRYHLIDADFDKQWHLLVGQLI